MRCENPQLQINVEILDSFSNGCLPFGFSPSFPNLENSLWCLCNQSSNLSFTLLDLSSQHISISISASPSSPSSVNTGDYGSTDYRQKRNLWNYLTNSSFSSQPWCVIGDFNAILLAEEKLSTCPTSPLSGKEFYEMALAVGLKDMGFRGNSFTWANNRQGQAFATARLDRAFSNSKWLDYFVDPVVSHLPRISSDHSPIMLAHRQSLSFINKPFRFEEKWISHKSFFKVVEDSWASPCYGSPQFILASKLKILKLNLKTWSKEVFGHFKIHVSEAEALVLVKEAAFEEQPSDNLLRALNQAKASLHNWLNMESTHWKQRAKVKWLQDGDRNTKFFHLSTKAKGIKNHIDKVKVDGILYEEGNQIKDQATSFFSSLFQEDQVIPEEDLFHLAGPSVSEAHNQFLVAIPSPEEINKAVFHLKRSSSPGPDGFSGVFFTNCWHIVSKEVIDVVTHFFSSGRL